MADDKNPGKWRPLKFAKSSRPKEGVEFRAAPRHLVSRITACSIIHLPSPIPMEAQLRDISTTGIGLTLCYPFRAGTYLAVDLKNQQGESRTWLTKVVHAQDQTDGSWHVGCEFVKHLSESDLDVMI